MGCPLNKPDSPQTPTTSAVVDDIPPEPDRHLVQSVMLATAPIWGLVLFFGGWELYVRVSGVGRLTLPRPSDILIHIGENPGFYIRHGWVTVQEAWWGFFLALLVALVVATGMAHWRFAERATMPVVVVIQSTPVAVLVPIFVLWFGFSSWPKILTAALFAWIPFVANALTGLRSIDNETHELLRSVHANGWEVYWKLRIPHALPYLFSAARICVGLALVGAVVGEFFNSKEGLGNTARVAQSRVLIDQLWGSVFVLAFIGVVLVLLVIAVEKRVLRWHSSQDTR